MFEGVRDYKTFENHWASWSGHFWQVINSSLRYAMTDMTRGKLMMHYPILKLHLVHSTITTFKSKLKAALSLPPTDPHSLGTTNLDKTHVFCSTREISCGWSWAPPNCPVTQSPFNRPTVLHVSAVLPLAADCQHNTPGSCSVTFTDLKRLTALN